HGRRVRDRDAVGDDPGGVVQAHRQACFPDGADPPSLRAQGLAGAARHRALLDHLGGARAGRPGDVEGALMTDTARQATRLDAISGHYDRWLLGVACALACLGVVMVGSSSISIAIDYGVGPFHYLVRHVAFLAVGVGLAVWLMRTELKTVEHYNHWLLLGCVALLLAVFIPGLGNEVNGARRWINLGVSSFQAVEAVKLLYIIWLASYLKRYSDEVTATWSAMLKPLGVAGLLVVLLVLQPDFGSLSLILAITGGMLVLGGVNMPRMFGPVLVGLPLLAVVAIAEPYRVRRLTSFLDPWADPFNSGYQLTNALMAVGRGEWF